MTSYGHVGWQPPAPSLVSLPVDQTKTEPKPAFYKLQFGDDVTGFNYYVRTTTVVIGRNCDMKGAPLPPPDERHLGGPTKPPLGYEGMEIEDMKPELPFGLDEQLLDGDLGIMEELALSSGDAVEQAAVSAQEKDGDRRPLPEIMVPTIVGVSTDAVPTQVEAAENVKSAESLPTPLPTLIRTTSEDQVEIKVEQPEPPIATDTHTASSAPPESFAHVPLSPSLQQRALSDPPIPDADKVLDMSIFDSFDPEALDALVQAATSDSPPRPVPPPPPPPMRTASDTLEHVDVDLGPLKSVSRNHAKISYFADLGHFCLEILGRNGAWVDDRYFVRGSTVPLNQGSQIQIATRIFSFILPPSPGSSPYGTPYDMSYNLEELPYPYNLPAQDLGYQEFYGEGGPGPSSAAALATRFPDQYNVFSAPDGHGLGFSMTDQNWLAEWSDNSPHSADSNESSDSDDSDDSDENSDDFDEVSEEEDSSSEEEPAFVENNRPATKIKIKLKRPVPQPESDLSSVSSSEDVESIPVPATGKVTIKGKGGKKVSPVKGHATKQPTKSKKQLTAKGVKAKAANADGMDIDEVPTEIKDDKSAVLNGDKVDTIDEKEKVPEKPKPKTTTTKKESKKKAKAAAAAASVSVAASDIPPTLAAISPPEPVEPPPALTLAALEASNPPPPPPVIQPPPPQPIPTLASLPPAPPPHPPMVPPQAVSGQPIRPPMPVRPVPIQTPSSSNTGTPEPQKPFYLTELIETPGRPGHIVVNVPIPPSGAGPRPPPGPLIGLDGEPFIGPPPIKPTATFAVIIHRALLYLPRGRGTLGEVCNWVAGEWEFYRLNIDSGWQNSIRHNLSLNKAFLKVPRIPEDDPESKGSVWIIDPKEGPLFEEKQRKDAMKAEGKGKNTDVRREKERIRVEERQKKLRDMSQDQGSTSSPHSRPLPPANHHPHPHPHSQPHSQHQQHQQQHMQPQQRPVATPVRPTPRPVSTHATTGISKGLPAKGKISVNITTITPALRQKSVIATTDQTGKLLPFTCDGSILTLDQTTFGHLTAEIVEKLSVLGPAQAVEVISAWVISKAKQMAAAAAASGKNGTAGSGNQARPPARPPHVNGGQAVRPQTQGQARPPPAKISPASGAQPLRPAQPAQTNGRPSAPATTSASGATKPAPPPSATSAGPAKPPVPNPNSGTATTSTATTPASASASANPAPPPKPRVVGPAPPGAGLTKVISMIAEVANAKGDVNIVGPHASALLRYIRVVGVDIDLKVADRIWATGVLPVLPPKKQGQGGKAVSHNKPNPTLGANSNGNMARPPPSTSTSTVDGGSAPANVAGAGNGGLKRKMDSVTGPSSGGGGGAAPMAPPASLNTNGARPTGGPVVGTVAAPITVDGGSELKKTKLEGVTEVK